MNYKLGKKYSKAVFNVTPSGFSLGLMESNRERQTLELERVTLLEVKQKAGIFHLKFVDEQGLEFDTVAWRILALED